MTTFGLHLTSYPVSDEAGSLAAFTRDVAAAAEGSGVFRALWLTDHVQNLGPEGPAAPMPESHLVLAAIAACTEKLNLGLLATAVVYRNPALLAKMITTLDVLSGGRAILGIGAGHPRTQAEAESYGYSFPSVGTRMDMLDHALEVIRSMTGPEPVSGAPPNWPRPLRVGGIPVLVADSGEQRLLRIAAKHADMINLSLPSGDSLARIPHKLDVLRRHCATIGRDPALITVTLQGSAGSGRVTRPRASGLGPVGPAARHQRTSRRGRRVRRPALRNRGHGPALPQRRSRAPHHRACRRSHARVDRLGRQGARPAGLSALTAPG
jgi:alkanesulfonate monooxygenase SsuD/methylene tetrahydromethanopterin reductase-like flavin-dependent oxidoreductase (luciferase family)